MYFKFRVSKVILQLWPRLKLKVQIKWMLKYRPKVVFSRTAWVSSVWAFILVPVWDISFQTLEIQAWSVSCSSNMVLTVSVWKRKVWLSFCDGCYGLNVIRTCLCVFFWWASAGPKDCCCLGHPVACIAFPGKAGEGFSLVVGFKICHNFLTIWWVVMLKRIFPFHSMPSISPTPHFNKTSPEHAAVTQLFFFPLQKTGSCFYISLQWPWIFWVIHNGSIMQLQTHILCSVQWTWKCSNWQISKRGRFHWS